MTKNISTQTSDKALRRLDNIFPNRHRQSGHQVTSSPAFTIVELLVVIAVIGILATITLVSFTGVTSRAKITVMQSDLSNSSNQLKIYQAFNNSYPTALDGSNCPTLPVADNTLCLKTSPNNTYTYTSDGTTFTLTETNTNGTAYGINNTSSPVALTQPTDCPTGFIPVPGSATYGTAGFCVMKYEAKNVGGVATSQAALTPWVSISQTSAITTAAAACTSCHLITEAEWLTIAQNVLSVSSNWNGGVVGTSYIPRGNSDSSAATDGTTDLTGINKRTLTLTNGQVIWDLAGNVWEWTAGTSTTGQPGVAGNAYASWIEWPNVTTPGTLSPNVFPSGTGISGASSWNSSNGIGQLISNPAETSLRGFFRGGSWTDGSSAGVLTLYLYNSPSNTYSALGFRVSR